MWQDVGKKIECCSDVITHVPSCGMDPGMACVMGSRPMSPVGQIETRNRNVYFELRKFPLRRDKGSAYWRTEESSRKRGKSFRSEKNVGGYDMNQVEGEHMISHREVCVCARMHDRWQIRNNLRLPEGCGQARGAAYRGKQAVSHGAVPTDQKHLICKQEQQNCPRQKQITVDARQI